MRKFGKFLGRCLLTLIILIAALWFFGPYEPADLTARFDESQLDGGVDAYLAQREAQFDDITEGVEKRVIWAGEAEEKTPISILYVHGFSATSQEIRPVPDEVAAALGANLIFTRLQGHGRPGAAMAEATVKGWMHDVAEGFAIARKTGDRVLVISTSTGGTLMGAAAVDETLMQDVAGIVFVSPSFALNTPVAPLLTWPAARYWLPLLAGANRDWEPRNEDHGRYWTRNYPSVAVMPMGALIKAVDALDLSQVAVPALFLFSKEDEVVRPDVTQAVSEEWGGPVEVINPVMGEGDDPQSHVIAGDIMSPGQNAATIEAITNWARGL